MNVLWTTAALGHLEQIQDFIAQDSPAAAHRLAVALTERATTNLGHSPMMGRAGRARGTRELILPDLSYVVVYRITAQVEILAIIHIAREWPKRFD